MSTEIKYFNMRNEACYKAPNVIYPIVFLSSYISLEVITEYEQYHKKRGPHFIRSFSDCLLTKRIVCILKSITDSYV